MGAPRPILSYVGPFPGPVTGQTVMTRHILDRLTERSPAPIAAFDIVRGDTGSRWRDTAIKARRAAAAFWGLAVTGRGRRVYISVDANRGMINTVAYALAARLGGAQALVLHHHSRNHVDETKPLMTALARVAGPRATHLCICPTMAAHLKARYPRVAQTAAMSNIISLTASAASAAARPAQPAPWRLGFMSKLGHAKGLARAIESLEAARAAGIPAELTLAGSFASAEEERFARDAAARIGPALQIEGPLYGEAKAAWFAGLDLFLFPSLYRNETQGIVNLEALAAGVPVLAYGGHCIEDDLAGLTDWCLPPSGDFAAHVVARITAIRASAEGLAPLRAQARDRFDALVLASDDAFDGLARLCLGETP